MRKEYKTPTMKAKTISPVSMLCLSGGEVNQGNGYRSGYNDYIEGDSERGYKYYIETNNNEQVTDWLVHTLTVANLLDEYKNQSTKILLEDVPSEEEHLETILDAIKYN